MNENDNIKKILPGDIAVWMIFLFLCGCSLVEVFSATSQLAFKSSNIWQPIIRHSSFLFGGIAVVSLLSRIHYRYFSIVLIFLPFVIILLALLPIIGTTINQASRFISISGIQFQPSEIAKLLCIIWVAFWLSKRGKMSDTTVFRGILWGVVPTVVCIFISGVSTALMLGFICFLMMFIGGLPARKLWNLALVVIVIGLIAALAVMVLPDSILMKFGGQRLPTVRERVVDFVKINHSDKKDVALDATTTKNDSTFAINDDNLQVSRAKMAIANGWFLGKLPGRSVQRDYLPQAYSDFIYAIIFEETGVLGGLSILILYLWLLGRVGSIAKRCEKPFAKHLVIGCGLLIGVQALVNISVAVGFFPVTGQPLPLISRGGTSTILTCAYIGIILSVSRFGAKMGVVTPEVAVEEDEPESETEEMHTEDRQEDIELITNMLDR
ncbi:MAG: FtsW/RodA/SpoVE family cell cycle protein [Tannerella sp.]|jgi:cell division protein FtsW|nr:FtsW/RodA/SpoVE family cell cycle protein [Tannerella sp.]